MSDFQEWIINAGKKLLKNPAEQFKTEKTQLTTTTIKKEFEKFVRRHFMVNTIDYIGMIATQNSYKNPSERDAFIDNRTRYVPELSTDRIAVYERGYGLFRIMILGVHGTKVTNIEDLYQDSRLVLGMVKDSFITTKYLNSLASIVKQSNLPRDNIYICGHSLGAYYALIAGYALQTNVRTFNGVNEIITLSNYPESVVMDGMFFPLRGMNSYKDALSYRMFGDPISLLNRFTIKNNILIKVDDMSINPLKLHSLDYMIEVCVPEIPLSKGSLSKARRFNRLPLRNEMQTEGTEFKDLQEDAKENPYSKLIDVLKEFN